MKNNKRTPSAPIFKAFNAVGKFLGYANLALDAVQLKANCGAESLLSGYLGHPLNTGIKMPINGRL